MYIQWCQNDDFYSKLFHSIHNSVTYTNVGRQPDDYIDMFSNKECPNIDKQIFNQLFSKIYKGGTTTDYVCSMDVLRSYLESYYFSDSCETKWFGNFN
jgi:hypothetical protein